MAVVVKVKTVMAETVVLVMRWKVPKTLVVSGWVQVEIALLYYAQGLKRWWWW